MGLNAKLLAVVVGCFSVSVSFGQDCRTPGKSCNDDKQCCGGCCILQVCISTYRDCRVQDDPCEDHYCGPGFECYLYKPPIYCLGCEVQPVCRPYKDPGPGRY